MKQNALFQPIAEIWRHRNLLWRFTLRNVELRHKGSHLGLIWSFLGPLLMLVLYVLVFGFIFGGKFKADADPETRIEYALVVFLGLAIHHFISEIITLSPTLITTNPNFVKKVVFPLVILPASTVGSALVHFGITLTLVFAGALFTHVPVALSALWWLPIILIPLVIGALGLAMGLAALGVFWRDIAQLTQFASLALLFASAVFYPITHIPAAAWIVLKFNPLIHVINEARCAAFWGLPVNPTHLGYLYIVSLILLLSGGWLFTRLRSSFADVL